MYLVLCDHIFNGDLRFILQIIGQWDTKYNVDLPQIPLKDCLKVNHHLKGKLIKVRYHCLDIISVIGLEIGLGLRTGLDTVL